MDPTGTLATPSTTWWPRSLSTAATIPKTALPNATIFTFLGKETKQVIHVIIRSKKKLLVYTICHVIFCLDGQDTGVFVKL